MEERHYTATEVANHFGISARALNKKLVSEGIAKRDPERNIIVAALENHSSYGRLEEEEITRSDGKVHQFKVWKWNAFGLDMILTRLRTWRSIV